MNNPALDQKIQAITRPDKSLWKYYLLMAIAVPPAFPFLILPFYFRYQTMKYSFTEDGISMSWGILFRREVIVNYARIQDIHLRSNIVERWLGLARILVQTASASRSAEMTIEGIKDYEALRDYLYSKTRGVRDTHTPTEKAVETAAADARSHDELAVTLREVALELRQVRALLEQQGSSKNGGSDHV